MKKEELLEQIKLAMKAHDKARLSILRQVNQAVKQLRSMSVATPPRPTSPRR